MEKKSHLEDVSDRIIILICKEIIKRTDDFDLDDSGFSDSCDDISIKLFGKGMDYIDIDYMSRILELNPDILSDDKGVKILRPELNLFQFNYIEKKTEWIMNKYRHEMSTYQHGVNSIIDLMNQNGDFDYWDGDLYDREVLDSDFDDTYVDNYSIRKIN
jgi:hypothetical protein